MIQYDRDYSSDEEGWIESHIYEYKYENAYPVLQKTTEFENVRTDTFEYEFEEGRVTEAVRSLWGPVDTANEEDTSNGESEGAWAPESRFVFEYTDTEISQTRYASMINYFLLEGGGNYYIFNWY